MKQITIFVTTATALLGMLTACSMGNDNKGEAVQADTIASDAFTPEAAVAHYLADSIGQYYSPGDLCIPSITVIDLDSSSAQDIKLWGDFWVFNYKQEL